ncbi:NitT/TauT family transport system permease protein [Acinetobacter calcoaceticus]|uniref:NitT/TauT family transport system permease protein n=1 Tax=Acinetobacter calcoaceticus TaxID=471 RepID=A0A4R1XEF3_ACICA|nr:NitT/TauT family transport system permease protein [Acinetobacter calcoaceticus]
MGVLVEKNKNQRIVTFINILGRLKKQNFTHVFLATASLMLCLIIWQSLAQLKVNLGLVNFSYVPTPVEVINEVIVFFQLPTALAHLEASIIRVLSGFALAGIVGVTLGLIIGNYKLCASFLLTPLEIIRPIPAVAWIPLAILIFPSSEASMIYITFIGALFPVLLNTIHGVESVDPRLIASARSLGAAELSIMREVIIPGSLPNIIIGLSIGMGTSWFCLVTAEMISGQLGIGYFTWESFTLQNYNSIVVGMLLIGALGMFSSALVRWIGKKITPWYHLRSC